MVTVGAAWAGVLFEGVDEPQAYAYQDGGSRWSIDETTGRFVTYRAGRPSDSWPESPPDVPDWSTFHRPPGDVTYVLECDAGWPWRTLHYRISSPEDLRTWMDLDAVGALPGTLSETTFVNDEPWLPIGVLPARFVASVVLYAAAWATLGLLWRVVRRLLAGRLARRGRCPTCRHALLDDQTTCPECGGSLNARGLWITRRMLVLTVTLCLTLLGSLGTFAYWYQSRQLIRPIHHAVARGDIEAVRAELDRGAPADAGFDAYGSTAITLAVVHRHHEILEELLDHAQHATRDLLEAVMDGNREAVRLLTRSAPPQTAAAFGVYSTDDTDMLVYLLERGMPFGANASVADQRIWRRVVAMACVNGSWGLAETVAGLGYSPDGLAVEMVATSDRPENLIRLLAMGVDLCLLDEAPETHDGSAFVLGGCDLPTLQLLLTYGLSPSQPGPSGDTPLHYAIDDHSEDSDDRLLRCRLLLEAGADPNAPGAWMSRTPLHVAVEWGREADRRLIDLLIAYGADPDRKDGRNDTPRDLASWHGGDIATWMGEARTD